MNPRSIRVEKGRIDAIRYRKYFGKARQSENIVNRGPWCHQSQLALSAAAPNEGRDDAPQPTRFDEFEPRKVNDQSIDRLRRESLETLDELARHVHRARSRRRDHDPVRFSSHVDLQRYIRQRRNSIVPGDGPGHRFSLTRRTRLPGG